VYLGVRGGLRSWFEVWAVINLMSIERTRAVEYDKLVAQLETHPSDRVGSGTESNGPSPFRTPDPLK
jgi:hypothetical protein